MARWPGRVPGRTICPGARSRLPALLDTIESLRDVLADRYSIEKELGHGGMARVFLARDLKHNRRVAVKVLRSTLASAIGEHRFLREIEFAAQLTHPHILPLHDSGSADGRLYYVMPFIEGESLRDRLTRKQPLSLDEAVQITGEVADALQYAHARGVVHRDIKPENILLSGGHAVVADFGIARALGEAGGETLTATGSALGTPAYMSPEQAAGRPVDGRTDIYSLGCVLYEMLAGQAPFRGPSVAAVLLQHQRAPVPPLRSAAVTVPTHVLRAIEIALAKDPAERFATASDFRAAITGVELRRPSRPIRWQKHRRAAVLVAAAALMASAGWWARTHSGTPFGEKDWILVADFDGPPDDPGLGDAVRELTTAELNQSRFLSTVPRQQLDETMRLAEVPETTHVGPQLARELAYRSAVRAVLVGSVSRMGSANYSIVLHVVDAANGSGILSVAGPASDSNLVTSVQQLARQVREGLGERRSAVEANLSLEQVATPSFVAYRRYVDAMNRLDKGDGIGSNRLLHEALAADTGFAAAWYAIGWNYLNDRMMDSARIAFAEALKRPHRLGVPQRYRVEADAAYALRHDIPAAIRAYDLYLEHDPRSGGVLNNRGLYLLAIGRYEDALRDFERAVEIQPFGPRQAQIQLLNQVATLIALGRLRDADEAARDLAGAFADYARMMRLVATGRWTEADSLASSASGAPSSPTWLRVQAVATAAAAKAARGAVAAADATLAEGIPDAPPDAVRWYTLARLLLAQTAGRPLPPLPAAAGSDTSEAGLIVSGLWLATAGDTATARERLRRVSRASADVRARLGYGPELLESSIAARAERWRDVIRLLGPAAAHGEHDTSLLDRPNSLSLRWAVADAYARLGRLDSATAMMELVVRPTRMPGSAMALRGIAYPFAHRRLALWYDALGRRNQARQHWLALIGAVRTPDGTLAPLLAEARAAARPAKPN